MHRSSLGECPDCGTTIPHVYKLIEYETADGWSAIYAECPDCGEVVHPRGRNSDGSENARS